MKPPTGTSHCHTIDQFQSDESRAGGSHPDDGESPPTPAHETDFRGVTLELGEAGGYAIRGPSLEISSGTWSLDGGSLALSEDPSQPRYFEKLRGVTASAKSIRVELTLVPDAHDGLDVMALEFQRKPPKAPKPSTKLTPRAVLEAVAAEKWKSRQQTRLDELPESERAEIYRAGWDGFVAGTFASDPTARSYRDQADFLIAGARLDVPATTHRHVAHAMRTLDDEGRNLFSNAIAKALVRLPPSGDDAIVAAAMSPAWLDVMAFYRFLGGVPPAWDRATFPQPAFDDACRAYLARPTSIFSAGFDDAMRLLDGRPELPAVLLRHHGRGALVRSHAAITTRGAGAEARASAIEVLQELEPRGAAIVNDTDRNTRRLAALAFSVLFREADTLPAVVLASLSHGGKGYSHWGMNDQDKALLRTSTEPLPDELRALVAAAFWL